MFTSRILAACLLFGALFAQPLTASCGAAPRLIPHGSVTLLDSGTVVDKEIPAPAGMLMACKGQCYIEGHGVQLMGADKTIFAVHEDETLFNVMVQQGSLDFALAADATPLRFQTPFDSLTARPHLIPVSSESVVRGTLQVTEHRAVLSMTQGSLELTTSQGQQLVQAGNALVLTQAVVGGEVNATTTTYSTTKVVAGALAIGAVAAGAVVLGSSGDGDGHEVSPQ
jgi:hypothetical protein